MSANKDRYQREISFLSFMLFLITASLTGCTTGNQDSKPSGKVDSSAIDEYHADLDIAMTLRSIADAISVGEPLDTTDYNFEGVLTDGIGHPLYTDIQGMPGVWEVDVLSPTSAVIRNTYLGDLLPEDLQSYVTGSLGISAENIVSRIEPDHEDESETIVYDFGGGYLRFESRSAIAPNGLEGPYITIIASKKNPIK